MDITKSATHLDLVLRYHSYSDKRCQARSKRYVSVAVLMDAGRRRGDCSLPNYEGRSAGQPGEGHWWLEGHAAWHENHVLLLRRTGERFLDGWLTFT